MPSQPTVLLLAAMSVGCGTTGTISKVEPDLRFVHDKAEVYVSEVDGLHRVAIDGSTDRVVFTRGPGAWEDLSDDGHLFAFTDSNTNLWIGDERTGQLRRVRSLDGRASAATFSPDGKLLAVSRHADYGRPQNEWTNDDTIYLVDTASLATTTLPSSSTAWPTKLRFSADGSALQLTMAWEGAPAWISLRDGQRHAGTSPLPERPRPQDPSASCAAKLDARASGTTINVVESGKPSRVLVAEVGRTRGFHDYRPDFSDLMLAPSCNYLLFGFGGDVWVTEIATNKTTVLAKHAWSIRFVP